MMYWNTSIDKLLTEIMLKMENGLQNFFLIFFQRVYWGHEYAIRNLEYAQHVEKDNSYIAKKLEWARVSINIPRFFPYKSPPPPQTASKGGIPKRGCLSNSLSLDTNVLVCGLCICPS